MSTKSSQRHQVQQQDYSMNRLILAVEEYSEDEAVVEALAVVETFVVAMDRLFVTTVDP